MHIIENGMKKPKYKKRMKKCEGKKFWFLIEVHFLIAAPNGHPSKYDWAQCCCKSATKWPQKFGLKMAITSSRGLIEFN